MAALFLRVMYHVSVLFCLQLTYVHVCALFGPVSYPVPTFEGPVQYDVDLGVSKGQTNSLTNTSITHCSFKIKYLHQIRNFARLVEKGHINFANIYIHFVGNFTSKARPNVFLSNIWVWTHTSNYGAKPYLTFDYDAGTLSLGLLDYYTSHGVDVTFVSHPEHCLVDFGSDNTTLAIAQAFGNMTMEYFKPSLERNNSIFCQIHRSDRFANGKVAYYLSLYFGIWQDLTCYKCCLLYRTYVDELKMKCTDEIIEIGPWTNFFSFLSIVIFLYLPFPITFVIKGLNGDNSTEWKKYISKSNYNDEYQDISDEQNPSITNETENIENGQNQVSPSKWLYLGIDTPVTILSAIRRPLVYLRSKIPHVMPRLQRFIIFAIVIPLPVIVKMLYYFKRHRYATEHRVMANIPVGFLSIPYGFNTSRENWLTILGGPYIVFGIYFTLGQICICTPNNFCAFIMSVLKAENLKQKTILSLDLSTLEAFGSVELFRAKGDEFLLRLIKGNLWTILNPEFWKFVLRVFRERFHRVFYIGNQTRVTTYLFTFMYACFCFLETVCCLVLHGCPTVYYLTSIMRAYLINCKVPHCNILFSTLLCICIMFIYYAFYLIFIRSSIFILLICNYVYVGIIIYPNLSIGFVVAVGTMLVYLGRSSQKLKDSYLVIFQHLVAISIGMENINQSNHEVTVRGKTLVIRNIDARHVKNLEIGGLNMCLTRDQRHVLSQAHLAESLNQSTSKFVRWNGGRPGIPADLFYFAIHKHKPLRVSVFIFIAELTAFTVLVTSLVQLVVVFHMSASFLLPAQIVTVIMLTVIPKINELVTSNKERQIKNESMLNDLRATVKAYHSEKKQKGRENNSTRLRTPV